MIERMPRVDKSSASAAARPTRSGRGLVRAVRDAADAVVEPSAARFEEARHGGRGWRSTCCERVTAIENNLTRVTDKLETDARPDAQAVALGLLRPRAARHAHHRAGARRASSARSGSAALWRERRKREPGEENARPAASSALRETVLAAYTGDEARAAFGRLVDDGFGELEKGRVAACVRGLERAAALSPDNAPLNHFLGEHFFRKGRDRASRATTSSRALDADPANARLRLLLGLACGDEGERRARTRASDRGGAPRSTRPSRLTTRSGGSRPRSRTGRARSPSSSSRLPRALAPRRTIVLGLAYYQLGRDRTALRHLTKAARARREIRLRLLPARACSDAPRRDGGGARAPSTRARAQRRARAARRAQAARRATSEPRAPDFFGARKGAGDAAADRRRRACWRRRCCDDALGRASAAR